MKPIITVENLSKKYRLGERLSGGYRDLRDVIVNAVSAPFRMFRSKNAKSGTEKKTPEILWALKDISFEVGRGEVIGIIGRNGAGKSTLLKILSQIVEPTSGRAELRGRVGSLLEVGTGFHPDLTGRENIFLNGSILGMSRREVRRKYDEIVDFSGIEQFLETPVKRYSSGMKVRLAFAVAAHLEPEIMIIDEVLAVGDAEFQKKCLGKMQDVAGSGRTILFVSHNMAAVEHLTSRAICLANGQIVASGKTSEVIANYLRSNTIKEWTTNLLELDRGAPYQPIISQVELFDANGEPASEFQVGVPVEIRISFETDAPLHDPRLGIGFETQHGVKVVWYGLNLQCKGVMELPPRGTAICRIPELPLVPGNYYLTVRCGAKSRLLDSLERFRSVRIIERDYYGTGKVPRQHLGLVVSKAQWTLAQDDTIKAMVSD